MDPHFEQHFARYQELLSRQDVAETDVDYTHLERHIGALRQLAMAENSSVAVMDLCRKRYAFLQSKFLPVLGLEWDAVMESGPRAFFERMHPSDIIGVLRILQYWLGFLSSQHGAMKKEFKLQYDFRLRTPNGDHRRFLQQLVPMELDARGNVWLMLMINDIIPERGEGTVPQGSVVHMPTGERRTAGDERSAGSPLTKREVEVLGLISKGLGSKQVADELFLSVNTVNNHRRNILEKMNANNTAEAVRYAVSIGLV